MNFCFYQIIKTLLQQIKMNQFRWTHSKNKSQLIHSSVHEIQGLGQKGQLKSKKKQVKMVSKSFSQSFMKQYSSLRSSSKNKYEKIKQKESFHNSLNINNKNYSDLHVSNTKKDQKKKLLVFNALDKKTLKDSIKAKSQSHKVNLLSSNKFRHSDYQKEYKSVARHGLLNLNHPNKSQAEINQHKMTKSISSTTKNKQFKSRILNHLQNKGKRLLNNQVSLSQRKKLSQKIKTRLNKIQSFNPKGEQQFQFVNSKINCISDDRNVEEVSKAKQDSLIQGEIADDKLKFTFSFRTRKGKHINNPKKVNQDSILVKQNISKKDLHIVAVADGHGPSGHYVSQFVIKTLSKLFSEEINQIVKSQNPKNLKLSINCPIQTIPFLPRIYDKIQTGLSCSQINSATSGCTLVNVIIQKNEVLCANVGDSRAILARQVDKKNWELIYLSDDHKPQNQIQRRRILKCGGRVHTFKGQKGQNLGPLRVWLPNQNIQGLAMTRSFGDNISKSVGVIHKPEIISVKIDEKDKFILVASDGVWQFVTNQQILQLIAPFYKQNKIEQACDALLKLSYESWTRGDDSVVDDISFVLLFLHC